MYRNEHPKPGFARESWENLNGTWDFEFDSGNSGEARGLAKPDAAYTRKIEVPFCPESRLSGIGDTDFHAAVWYRRTFRVAAERLAGRVILHIGACDYLSTVYINGQKAGTHKGGYVSFSLDITAFVHEGDNILTVRAQDDVRDRMVPRGKQSEEYASHNCDYTRTTGIWQTVWLEYTPKTYIADVKYYPDATAGTLTLMAQLCGAAEFTVRATFEGREMGKVSTHHAGGHLTLTLPLAERHLWELGKGGLYDLTLTYGDDRVSSYFGLRSIEYAGNRFLLNGRSVFQRLVLDQGFYPDGIYTAPSDAELLADIDRSMAMGFNGARLHQKVFEERFLYHADRRGYMVWGEYPNWGLDHSYADAIYGILDEWLEEVARDFNHPSIVGWCPLNETWDQKGRAQCNDLLRTVYLATKAADPTRPCIDTSGNYHVVTDIYDVHDYNQNPETFRASLASLATDGTYADRFAPRQTYTPGMPFFLSEYGGIRWTDKEGWGYGNAPKTEEEFLTRLEGLTDALLDNPGVFAYCYTQLTDVEQEQNGLYTYDRRAKFPPEKIAKIFGKKAAIED